MQQDNIKNTVTFKEIKRLFYAVNNLNIQGKSFIILCILWFFMGFFGIHRLYIHKVTSGIIMGLLTIIGYLTHFILIGYLFWAIVWLWWAYDILMLTTMLLKQKYSSC